MVLRPSGQGQALPLHLLCYSRVGEPDSFCLFAVSAKIESGMCFESSSPAMSLGRAIQFDSEEV